MNHDPGKEPIPQKLQAENEALQCEVGDLRSRLKKVNARDAETMLEMRREIGELRSKLNRSQFKNQTLWRRLAQMEREKANG